jgi:hypothetical protein
MKREASSDCEDRPVAKQARLSPYAFDRDKPSSLVVKQSVEPLFRKLCRDFGWSPTELVCGKISDLLSIDTSRTDNVEPALFAFVQYLPFIWNNGALLIGSKKINNIVRSVWYKPLRLGDSVGESIHLNQGDSFNGESLHKSGPKLSNTLVDRFWPSFITAFDLSSRKGDYRYIMGVHTILHALPKLRKSCDDRELRAWAEKGSTTATVHIPLKKYELPVLPESVWMSKPLEMQRPPPIPPPAGSSSHSSAQSSSTAVPRPSFRDIDRIQSMILRQRGRLIAGSEQQDRRESRLRRSSVLKSEERSSEPTEATEVASDAATETSNDTASQVDRQPTPMGLLDLSAIDHVNHILQHNNIDVSSDGKERTAEAQVQLTVTFPARVSQQKPALQLSPITSTGTQPVVPSCRLVLEALCALAMTAADDNTQ